MCVCQDVDACLVNDDELAESLRRPQHPTFARRFYISLFLSTSEFAGRGTVVTINGGAWDGLGDAVHALKR